MKTPKEDAQELYEKFLQAMPMTPDANVEVRKAKQCALIAQDDKIILLAKLSDMAHDDFTKGWLLTEGVEQHKIKTEIEKL